MTDDKQQLPETWDLERRIAHLEAVVRRLQGHVRRLRGVLQEMADDREEVAGYSHALADGEYRDEWQRTDPDEFDMWRRAHAELQRTRNV